MLLFHLDRVIHVLLSHKKTGRGVNAFMLLLSNSLRSNENKIYFLKQLGNKGKRQFSASIAVFSCNMLRGNTVIIFLS